MILILASVVGLSLVFEIGSFFSADSCGFNKVIHPDTGETYSSISDYRDAYQEYTGASDQAVDQYFNDAEFQIRQGQVFEKTSVCESKRLKVE